MRLLRATSNEQRATSNEKHETHQAVLAFRVSRFTFYVCRYVICSIFPVDAERTTASVTAAPWTISSSGIGNAGPPLAAWANASRQARVTSRRAAPPTTSSPLIG